MGELSALQKLEKKLTKGMLDSENASAAPTSALMTPLDI